MWPVSAILFVVWFVLKVLLHKGGYVHLLLLTAISFAVVQFITDRKTRYHRAASGDDVR